MNIAPYILISRMPDVIMCVIKSKELVGGQFVGIYLGAGGYLIADNRVGGACLSVFYRNRVNLAAPFYNPSTGILLLTLFTPFSRLDLCLLISLPPM